MSTDCQGLTFKFAQQRVDAYSNAEDVLIKEHGEAMDCYDCEAFLQLGIDAFRWILRADFALRQAVYHEQYEFDGNLDEAIRTLVEMWLKPCERAKGWSELQKTRGYALSNLSEFEECCDEAQAIVESFEESGEMPQALVALAEEALEEHRNGQTAEFF